MYVTLHISGQDYHGQQSRINAAGGSMLVEHWQDELSQEEFNTCH